MRKKQGSKGIIILLYSSLFLVAASVTLYALARECQGFADWYAICVYPVFAGGMCRISSLVPFSLAEVLLYLGLGVMILTFLWTAVHWIICLCRKRKYFHGIALWLAWVYFGGAVLLFLYVCNCGIQYSRTSFSAETGFSVEEATEEELRQTCLMVIHQINREVDAISFDENGSSVLTGEKGETARQAMIGLGEQYSCMKGFYPAPKGILASEILSYQQLSGVYSPFTVEANYNADMPDWEIPATMCHELSHLRGFMREDEAGFIAYLACMGSSDPEFRYSGAMHAFSYCMNAYYQAAGADAYRQLYELLDERAALDRRNSNAWWGQYQGRIAEVANTVNDTYLKANRQPDGVKSYGRIADLMIACWRRSQEQQSPAQE